MLGPTQAPLASYIDTSNTAEVKVVCPSLTCLWGKYTSVHTMKAFSEVITTLIFGTWWIEQHWMVNRIFYQNFSLSLKYLYYFSLTKH